ncbi:hypothetical protein JCM3770_002299 [Rhodotorula araucariae]
MSIKLSPATTARLALTSYLTSLERRPVLTKSVTSGTLYLLSELVSTQLARPASTRNASPSRTKRTNISPVAFLKRYQQALKLAAYGFFVGAPLDHFLYGLLARIFAGRTSRRARIAEVVTANVAILPVQNAVYLAALSVIGGAKSARQVLAEVKGPFLEVMQLTVVVSTLSLAFAQRFVPPQALVPFLTLIAASVDTAVNVQAKKRALAAEERRRAAARETDPEEGGEE